MTEFWGIVWLVILLLGNAFFVAAEFAVIAARRSAIEPLAEAGGKRARVALWAMEHATLMLATCQLGITVCSLLILNVSEPAIHGLLHVPLSAVGLSEEWAVLVAFIFTLLLVSYLHVVFGEMVPKNLSFSLSNSAVLWLAPPLVFISRIFKPIIYGMNAIANGAVRLFRVEPKSEAASAFTLEEVQTIVSQSTLEGVLEDRSGTLSATFEFTSKTVQDVAVPLEKVVSLIEPITSEDIEKAVAEHGFSRYFVEDSAGRFLGYIHIKDVLSGLNKEDSTVVPTKRIRQQISLVEGTELEDALARMRQTGSHLANIVDQQGIVTSVLFLEDILEELVGEVRDATRRREEY